MIDTKGLSAVQGFKFAGIAAESEKRNIGIVYSTEEDTCGAAVYTKSDIVAAPIVICRKNESISPIKRALLINSGNANAFTGKQGLLDAVSCVSEVSNLLEIPEEHCFIGSTGVIGQKMPMNTILGNMKNVVNRLDTGAENALHFIEATMTTDTRPKQASISFKLNGKTVTIAASIKGAGMIMPNMATMLCTVITDVSIAQELLHKALQKSIKKTLNCISIDGDTSTNDTVYIMANGLAGNATINTNNRDFKVFQQHLQLLLEHMGKEVVKDGEGVTKFITINVLNTPSRKKARKVALSIANSPLVKTAFFGKQLNWGRLLMAIGKAQTKMDCSIINIAINGHTVVKEGEPALNTEQFKKAEESLEAVDVVIDIDFNQGSKDITVWTCDFSYDYVKINADYMT